ncbi:hypothetical protein PIROE2DRAFT_9487, partial [Piromyces sp. E2]
MATVNKHISEGCPDPGTSTSKSTKKVCQYKGCKTAQLIPFVCPKCKKSFCIKHRLDMDHDCPLKNVNIDKSSKKNTPNTSSSSLNKRPYSPPRRKQCHLKECKQLDFLPFTCEYCKFVFCHEHWKPENHHCEKESTERKDFHTTICPVCGKIVPIKRDEDPNIR